MVPAEFCGVRRWPLAAGLPWDWAPSPQVCRSKRTARARPETNDNAALFLAWILARDGSSVGPGKMPFLTLRIVLDVGSSWALVSPHFPVHPLVHLVFGIW